MLTVSASQAIEPKVKYIFLRKNIKRILNKTLEKLNNLKFLVDILLVYVVYLISC